MKKYVSPRVVVVDVKPSGPVAVSVNMTFTDVDVNFEYDSGETYGLE